MDQRFTAALAIWGACLSTIAFGWQILQWLLSRPRIAAKAQVREGPWRDDENVVAFELRNRGGKPTTIEEIMFVQYSNCFFRLLRFPSRIEYLSAWKSDMLELPVLLQPGEIWKGSCYLGPRDDEPHLDASRRKRFDAGQLFYRIRCTHSDRTIAGVVKPESFFERL